MKLNQEYKQLDYQERQTIAVCLELELSIRAIARVLDRAPYTVSREINRPCTFRPSIALHQLL